MSGSILARARPELLALAGYSSARMEATGGRLWLNANESPWPSPADGGFGLHRYPEPQPPGLRARCSDWLGVPVENLLVGRGSDEAIDLLTRAFCRAGVDAVITSPPTFGMYQVSASIQGARVVEVPLDAAGGFAWPREGILSAVDDTTKLVWVCTPNNPTGTAVPRFAILDLARRLEGRALVVVDEAYVEFGGRSATPHVRRLPNLVVVRTFSKAFALAGARIGYCLAAPEVVEDLRRVRLPYHLSALTQAAGLVALRHRDAALAILDAVREQRDRISATLPQLGCQAFPSDANFVLFRPPRPAGEVFRGLLDRGVLVRDFSELVPGCLRVTAGTPEEVDRFLAALKEVLA